MTLPPSTVLKNGAFVLELGHVVPGVAKFQQYLLSVLPQLRGERPDSGRCLAELDGAVDYLELHAGLVLHFTEEAVLPGLGVIGHLDWGLDASQNQVEFLCNGLPLSGSLTGHDFIECSHKGQVLLYPLGVGIEPGGTFPFRISYGTVESWPVPVRLGHDQHDPFPVPGLVALPQCVGNCPPVGLAKIDSLVEGGANIEHQPPDSQGIQG